MGPEWATLNKFVIKRVLLEEVYSIIIASCQLAVFSPQLSLENY